jgi:dolichol-phosphate mannosyltransferase
MNLLNIPLYLVIYQTPAFLLFMSRFLKGPFRKPPVEPQTTTLDLMGKVSIVVPTLNEANRISPCLDSLTHTSYEVREIIIVDSNSEDGTQDLVKEVAKNDPRIHLITDPPLPSDWVGRPWALHHGFLNSSPLSEWILGVDADTQPDPKFVTGLLKIAESEGYDLISLSPQFILKYPGEWWLQPALLMTLLFRFDPAGINTNSADRVMANGQCFLCKRSILTKIEGYTPAKSSFCDDVTLARHIASQGYKVGFLDGKKVLKVRMYEGMTETWQEWGRSLDLKDATNKIQQWADLWLLSAVQALPIPVSIYLWFWGNHDHEFYNIALGLNLFLVFIRFALLAAIAPSYTQEKTETDQKPASVHPLFYLSPFADPLAVLRILLSTLRQPKQWRGRVYGQREQG